MIIDLEKIPVAERQYYLQHAVAPRPICFASTIDKAGNVNLSPFSYFNVFSSDPPIVIFSPGRKIRDKSTKHSLENVLEIPEVVINIVTYDMVHQASLASSEFPKHINEFEKAGFTEEPATLIKPPMVKESKIKMECKVIRVEALGEQGGAGNLVICEVLRIHIKDSLFDQARKLDQRKINHVARLGDDWYCVVNEHNLFQVQKPAANLGIGIDALPDSIRNSNILTGNHLGQLANIIAIPDVNPAFEDDHLKQIIQYYSLDPLEMEKELHGYAKKLLEQGKISEAWQVLLTGE